MRKSFEAFCTWAAEHTSARFELIFCNCEATESALRAFGPHLCTEGLPRYLLVYAIAAVQDKFPSYRNRLTAAWQVDRKWQLAERRSCRAVLPLTVARAAITVAALWGWHNWAGVGMLSFIAMLHPAEMMLLQRRDLVSPWDSFGVRNRVP